MRKIRIKLNDKLAAILTKQAGGYELIYLNDYSGEPVSRALPVETGEFFFDEFPPFLDGLLPEGIQLESLLRNCKIDAEDYLSQIIQVGNDLVGAITVEELFEDEQ